MKLLMAMYAAWSRSSPLAQGRGLKLLEVRVIRGGPGRPSRRGVD